MQKSSKIKWRWFRPQTSQENCTISGCKRVCTGIGLPYLPICKNLHVEKMQHSPGWTQIGSVVKFGKPLSQQSHTRYPIMMLMIRALASSPSAEKSSSSLLSSSCASFQVLFVAPPSHHWLANSDQYLHTVQSVECRLLRCTYSTNRRDDCAASCSKHLV